MPTASRHSSELSAIACQARRSVLPQLAVDGVAGGLISMPQLSQSPAGDGLQLRQGLVVFRPVSDLLGTDQRGESDDLDLEPGQVRIHRVGGEVLVADLLPGGERNALQHVQAPGRGVPKVPISVLEMRVPSISGTGTLSVGVIAMLASNSISTAATRSRFSRVQRGQISRSSVVRVAPCWVAAMPPTITYSTPRRASAPINVAGSNRSLSARRPVLHAVPA